MKFEYTAYECYPRATEISYFRNALKTALIRIMLALLAIGLVLWFFLPVLAGVILAIGAGLMIYLLVFYNRQTQKKIERERDAMDAMRALTRDSHVEWIKLIRQSGEGEDRCMRCLKDHVYCENHEIWFNGNRWSIPICKECRDELATFVHKNPLF